MISDTLLVNTLIIFTLSIVGIIPVLAGFRFTDKNIDAVLGFSGGVMVAVSFSMIYETSEGILQPLFFAAGFTVMWILEAIVPHEHMIKGYEGPVFFRKKFKMTWLIAFSMILHNIPEGLTVGSSTIINQALGFSTAMSIGLQDIVEGIMAGLPYIIVGKRVPALLLSLLAASAEAGAALASGYIGTLYKGLNAILAGVSSGAMVFIVVHEIIPETHKEHSSESTIGVLLGVVAALLLEYYLG
ncbi:MAG: ZIP family metal transporter [Desulfurococcus sp.]|uniref:ZIP family metal transporter n=1 Tax=Desulfurococcus sp. TaxID=51678 RepID=UPI00315ED458